jgi:hypothetical protein
MNQTWSVQQKMKRVIKKKAIVDWKETDFSHLHRVPKLRYQRKEFIHKTAIKYIEKLTEHSDPDLNILWNLLTAYENA